MKKITLEELERHGGSAEDLENINAVQEMLSPFYEALEKVYTIRATVDMATIEGEAPDLSVMLASFEFLTNLTKSMDDLISRSKGHHKSAFPVELRRYAKETNDIVSAKIAIAPTSEVTN